MPLYWIVTAVLRPLGTKYTPRPISIICLGNVYSCCDITTGRQDIGELVMMAAVYLPYFYFLIWLHWRRCKQEACMGEWRGGGCADSPAEPSLTGAQGRVHDRQCTLSAFRSVHQSWRACWAWLCGWVCAAAASLFTYIDFLPKDLKGKEMSFHAVQGSTSM